MKTGEPETCCGAAPERAGFEAAGRTDTGKRRKHNEDAILVRGDLGLWAVADGLGGHACGDYASTMIVDRLAALAFDHGSVADRAEAVEDLLADVNRVLRAEARSRGVDLIASTVVVAIGGPGFLLCGWVGDSRAYGYREGRLRQLTRDHAYGAANGQGSPLEGSPGPVAPGVLTRAVGAEEQLFVDWVVAPAGPGTRLFLCSDGINKELSDAELEQALGGGAGAADPLDRLFELALARAARDNLSAVIVQTGTRSGDPRESATPVTDLVIDRVNPELQRLDDARRLGQLAVAEYRQRRRALLVWLEAPLPSPPPAAAVPAPFGSAPAEAPARRAPRSAPGARIVAGLLIVAAVAALFWWLGR